MEQPGKDSEKDEDKAAQQVASIQGKGRPRFYICQNLTCLMEKNIRSCIECDDFPCPKVEMD